MYTSEVWLNALEMNAREQERDIEPGEEKVNDMWIELSDSGCTCCAGGSVELFIICLGQNLQRGHSLRDASAHGCQGAEVQDIVCQPCLLTWSQLFCFSTFAFFI